MTGYKPSNFDKGFRSGKGWGELSVRARFHPRTSTFGFFSPFVAFERNHRLSDATRERSTTASRASP